MSPENWYLKKKCHGTMSFIGGLGDADCQTDVNTSIFTDCSVWHWNWHKKKNAVSQHTLKKDNSLNEHKKHMERIST